MVANEYLGQKEFRVAIGPARVGYLIAEDSKSGFRRAVQEACTRWGGVTEPIIPVHSDGKLDGFWEQVINLLNLDGIINVNLEDNAAMIVASRLGLRMVELIDIDRSGPGQFTCHPTVTGFGQTTEYLSLNSVTGIENRTTVWSLADDSLDLWAVTAAGSLTLDAREQSDNLGDGISVTSDYHLLALSQLGGRTLLDRTAIQHRENWASPGFSPTPAVVWLCEGDGLLDCLMYWNLRALRPLAFEKIPMVLLPIEKVVTWDNFAQNIHRVFANRLDEFSPDAFICSLTVKHEALRNIANSWGLIESQDEPRSQIIYPPPHPRTPPYTYRLDKDPRVSFISSRRYGLTAFFPVQVFRNGTWLQFESPVSFNGSGRVKLSIASDIFSPLPHRASIAQMILNNSKWNGDLLEVYTLALSAYKLDGISVPTLDQVVRQILKDSTESWALSDKGKLGDGIAATTEIEVLRRPGIIEVVQALTTRRSGHLLEELRSREHTEEEFDRAKFVAEIGGRLERRSQRARDFTKIPIGQRVECAETLVSLGWAERGYRVNCDRCGLTSFISLADVTQLPRCPGCQFPQRYEHNETSLDVFYRLNSLIDLASDQGVLPHLMAIVALGKPETTYVIPGINVAFGDGARKEIDLFGVYESKVLSGEVKTKAKEFTTEQIRRDVELGRRLNSDIHVMACFGELDSNQLDFAQALCDEQKLELKVLDLKAVRN